MSCVLEAQRTINPHKLRVMPVAAAFSRSSLTAFAAHAQQITRRSRSSKRLFAPHKPQQKTYLSTMSESFLKGVELVNAKGDTCAGEDVARGKLLALYFAVRSSL